LPDTARRAEDGDGERRALTTDPGRTEEPIHEPDARGWRFLWRLSRR